MKKKKKLYVILDSSSWSGWLYFRLGLHLFLFSLISPSDPWLSSAAEQLCTSLSRKESLWIQFTCDHCILVWGCDCDDLFLPFNLALIDSDSNCYLSLLFRDLFFRQVDQQELKIYLTFSSLSAVSKRIWRRVSGCRQLRCPFWLSFPFALFIEANKCHSWLDFQAAISLP